VRRKQEAGGFAQAALGAVALDGPADALGGGEADADEGSQRPFSVLAVAGLDQHCAPGAVAGLGAGKEIRALAKALDLEVRDLSGVGHTDTLA
jgi:hypothetical protein